MPVLQFKGKTAVESYHYTVPHHTLDFDKKLSLLPKGEKPGLDGNLIVEGDNLLALKALLPTHAGRVKCIYIDPPYNTGSEAWVYNDNLTQPQFKEWIGQVVGKEGEDACRHDKWCCMMYPRLALLKELLREDGVMLVSIDDNEIHHLRMLMDELFGEANLLATLVWEKGRKNDAKFFSVGHEYMLVYARSKELLKKLKTVWREPKPGAAEVWDEYSRLRDKHGNDNEVIQEAIRVWHSDLPERHPSKALRRYLHIDKDGPWRDRDISWPGGGGPRYDVIHPVTKQPCAVPERGWGFSAPEEMQRQIDLGLVVFREDHTKPPLRKAHLRPIADELTDEPMDGEEELEEEEAEVGMQVMPSCIYKQSQVAVKYLRKLMGGKVFPNPKDHEILARLIRYCTSESDLVLDSFAGSGTTGQAVMQANHEDKGTRKFVLIQQKYDTKEDEKQKHNICTEITRERVKRAVEQEDLTGAFTYARLGRRLFGEYRDLGEPFPAYDELAKYIFYTETSRDFDAAGVNRKTGRIGEHQGSAYYLLYTDDPNSEIALDTVWLKEVGADEKCRKLVVYCEKIWLHRSDLLRWQEETNHDVRPMLVPFNLK